MNRDKLYSEDEMVTIEGRFSPRGVTSWEDTPLEALAFLRKHLSGDTAPDGYMPSEVLEVVESALLDGCRTLTADVRCADGARRTVRYYAEYDPESYVETPTDVDVLWIEP